MDSQVSSDNLAPTISSTSSLDYGDFKSINSIYVVGSNIYGLGLLNTVRVLLASAISNVDPKMSRFTILDPGRIDYSDLLDSPFLNGDIITDETDILTILETASEIKFDFQNIIVLNQYDWLKNSFDTNYSSQVVKAVNNLVDNAKKNNIVLIVVDRNVDYDEKVPNFDAILCFQLQDEKLSKVILGCSGAEKLKNHGDSLYLNRKTGELRHGQIPLLSDKLAKNGKYKILKTRFEDEREFPKS